MYSRIYFNSQKANRVETGSILIAQPFWENEVYKRSVILVVEHNHNRTVGIILNKLTTISTYDILPELEIYLPVYFGGTLDPEIVTYIHNYPGISSAKQIGDDLFLGGDFEQIINHIRQKRFNLNRIKFYVGLTYWEGGEIYNEIRENKWWTSAITVRELFNTQPEELWPYELIRDGHVYGILNEYPDPGIN